MRTLPRRDPMQAYEYVLAGPIPEIDGEPGDVLVWQYPRVVLVSKFQGPQYETRSVTILPDYWVWLFTAYDDRLIPQFSDAPPPVELAIAAGERRRPASPRPAPSEAAPSHLRLLP